MRRHIVGRRSNALSALIFLAGLLLAVTLPSDFVSGAASGGGSATPSAASDAAATIAVTAAGRTQRLSADDVAALPMVTLKVSFETEKGQRSASFQGPLLWSVLQHVGALNSKPRDRVHQVLRVTGHDGYAAALALGELDPEFEGKQVILATRMDGRDLGPGHLRVVVPGDKRGGRDVRDVASLAVE